MRAPLPLRVPLPTSPHPSRPPADLTLVPSRKSGSGPVPSRNTSLSTPSARSCSTCCAIAPAPPALPALARPPPPPLGSFRKIVAVRDAPCRPGGGPAGRGLRERGVVMAESGWSEEAGARPVPPWFSWFPGPLHPSRVLFQETREAFRNENLL